MNNYFVENNDGLFLFSKKSLLEDAEAISSESKTAST